MMLKILDRQLTQSYTKAFVVCLVSLLSMYVVVDLFMNLDEFTHNASGTVVWQRLTTYYGFKIVEIFDRLCEPIILLAAMFTVAWMQRNNEVLPLLSAGISTRRIIRPVLIASAFMVALGVLNQELMLPQVDPIQLELRGQDKESGVRGAFDTNGIYISGRTAIPDEMMVKDFLCNIPAHLGRDGNTSLQAKEARFVPDTGETRTGGWLLTGASSGDLNSWRRTDILEMIVPGKYFLKTDLTFSHVTRSRNWFTFVDTYSLLDELNKGGVNSTRLANLATIFHMRLTRPILGLLLVFMGLSIILRNHQRNLYISAGLCVLLCLLFFASSFVCRWLGDSEVLYPALAAWLPVFVFGPLSFVMFDAVHT